MWTSTLWRFNLKMDHTLEGQISCTVRDGLGYPTWPPADVPVDAHIQSASYLPNTDILDTLRHLQQH